MNKYGIYYYCVMDITDPITYQIVKNNYYYSQFFKKISLRIGLKVIEKCKFITQPAVTSTDGLLGLFSCFVSVWYCIVYEYWTVYYDKITVGKNTYQFVKIRASDFLLG